MPGFVHAVNPGLNVSTGATRVFSLSFIFGFLVGKFTEFCVVRPSLISHHTAAIISYLLHWVFPYQYHNTALLESSLDGQEVARTQSESGGLEVEAVLVSESKGVSHKGGNGA